MDTSKPIFSLRSGINNAAMATAAGQRNGKQEQSDQRKAGYGMALERTGYVV